MNHYELTEQIRGRIQDLLSDIGAAEGALSETVLIRDGYYCGRRFELDGLSAVWFIEENQIKCFSRDGSLHTVVDAVTEVQRRAA